MGLQTQHQKLPARSKIHIGITRRLQYNRPCLFQSVVCPQLGLNAVPGKVVGQGGLIQVQIEP